MGISALVPSLESFRQSRSLILRQFDKGRHGFARTNVGISLKAEMFQLSETLNGGDTLYAIRLSCAFAWPPLNASKSPIMIFLQRDSSREDLQETVPTFFRRTGSYLRTWSEVSSAAWKSHGLRVIFVKAELEPTREPRALWIS